MFLSQLVGKEIFVNGAFKGVCLGIGVSKKNCSVKYLLCSLSTTDTSHIDFAVNFTAITEIFTNGIHLSSLRPVIPKHCWKVFQNRPIYTLDGVKVGEITDSVIAGNRYMETGEIIENYHLTGFSRWMQRIMRVLIIVYRIATPVLFSVSLIYFIYQTFILIKKYSDILFVQWISAASLLALFLLRTFMIGYVDATSYSAISNPAYQAGSYVVMGCFISLQCAVFIYEITSKVLISKDRIK